MSNALIISALVYPFRDQASQLLKNCIQKGLDIRAGCGVRTLDDQNKLWRRSRSAEQVALKIESLKSLNAPYLAHCLERVGPQANGPHETNDIGGLSWHNWGEALDVEIFRDGVYITDGADEAYSIFGDTATSMGLTWGGQFTTFKDYDHVQLSACEPLHYHTLSEVDSRFAASNA